MAIEAAQRDSRARMKRFHAAPPDLSLTARIKGNLFQAGATLTDAIAKRPPVNERLSGALALIGVKGASIARRFARTLENTETIEEYVDPASRREQMMILFKVLGPILRIERQRMFQDARANRTPEVAIKLATERIEIVNVFDRATDEGAIIPAVA